MQRRLLLALFALVLALTSCDAGTGREDASTTYGFTDDASVRATTRCKRLRDRDRSRNIVCALLDVWDAKDSTALTEAVAGSIGQTRPDLVDPIAECIHLAHTANHDAASEALLACLEPAEVDLTQAGAVGNGGIEGALGLAGGLRPTGPAVGAAVTCGSSGVHPWLAQASRWDFNKWPHSNEAPPSPNRWKEWKGYENVAAEADAAWRDYSAALRREAETWLKSLDGEATQDELEAAEAETKQALDKANEAIKKRDEWAPGVVQDGTRPPGDDGTAVARTSPDAEDPCAAAAQFLAECAAADWATSPCKLFLEKLSGCHTTIMLIAPDGEPACAQTQDTIDTDTFEAIMRDVCWSRVRPAGPGEDPCAPPSVEGAIVIVGAPGNACSDPRAMTNPDDTSCAGEMADPATVADTLLGGAERRAELSAKLQKLCGCVIPPLSGGGSPSPGPVPPPFEVVAWHADGAYSPYQRD